MSLPKINKTKKDFFSGTLLRWYKPEARPMPWKGIKDPYKIWLSEVILQQTRVEQGWNYYEKIITKYPDVRTLAKATEEKFFKDWQGLGYYSRARNILHTANHIVKDLDGKLPADYESWLEMKGVGEYTAAAISSFAFNERRAVVDGNVFRVLARFFGIKLSTDESRNKKYFVTLANELIDEKAPGIYNQAIMDFGATVCTPLAPKCNECPFHKSCYAFVHEEVNELPVRTKKLVSKDRFFNYFLIRDDKHVLLSKRTQGDIWKGLYEFPMIETKKPVSVKILMGDKKWKNFYPGKKIKIKVVLKEEQQLSHQKIHAKFYQISDCGCDLNQFSSNYKKIQLKNLGKYAFPKIVTSAINDLF